MEEWDESAGDYDAHISERDRAREELSLENAGYREGLAAGESGSPELQGGFDAGYGASVHLAYRVGLLRGMAAALAAYLQRRLQEEEGLVGAAGGGGAAQGLRGAWGGACAAREQLCRVLGQVAGAAASADGKEEAPAEGKSASSGGGGEKASPSASSAPGQGSGGQQAIALQDLLGAKERVAEAIGALRAVLQWGETREPDWAGWRELSKRLEAHSHALP